MNLHKGHSSLLQAFKYACTGIATTIKNERNIKIELGVAVCALVAGLLLRLEPLEWVVIILCIVLVLGFELANTALESLADLVNPSEHPLVKQAKDAMAGAVLLCALGAAVCGSIIYIQAALRLGGA